MKPLVLCFNPNGGSVALRQWIFLIIILVWSMGYFEDPTYPICTNCIILFPNRREMICVLIFLKCCIDLSIINH